METTFDPTAATTTQASPQDAGLEAALGRDEFLKLLIAKLQAQDPLDPAKDTDFIDQLATFSSLEQLISVNDNLEGLAVMQTELINSQALDLIGKEALVGHDGTVNVTNGAPDKLFYELRDPASAVTVTIRNESGDLIKELELVPVAGGRAEISWDGTDLGGNVVEDGIYNVEVEALGQQGEDVPLAVFRSIFIDGVNFASGSMTLSSNGREIPFEAILEIRSSRTDI